MKHLFLGLWTLTLIASFPGCKKDTTQKDATSVIGTWELREASGGTTPGSLKFPPGNGNLIKLSATDYGVYKNNQLVNSGSYKIIADTTVEQNVCIIIKDDQYRNRIEYGDSTTSKIFFQLSDGKISFLSGCYAADAGLNEVYQKVSTIGMK